MAINFSELKNDTARKNTARLTCNEIIFNAFKQQFGDDNVVMLKNSIVTENGVEFSAGTVIACVGETKDKNGFSVDVVIEVSAKVKSWNNTGTKRQIKAVNFLDILDAIQMAEKQEEGDKTDD